MTGMPTVQQIKKSQPPYSERYDLLKADLKERLAWLQWCTLLGAHHQSEGEDPSKVSGAALARWSTTMCRKGDEMYAKRAYMLGVAMQEFAEIRERE